MTRCPKPSGAGLAGASLLVAAFIAACVAGCAASAPPPILLAIPDAARDLPSNPAAAPAPMAAGSAPLLAIGRVDIPENMIARRVRYRSDPATLAEWPNTYWGERIEVGVTREFAVGLRRRLPDWTFCDSNCAGRSPTLGLRVEVAPLDYWRAEHRLDARARVTVVEGDLRARPLRSREFEYRIDAGANDTPQAEAEAIGRFVGRLAADAASMVGAPAP